MPERIQYCRTIQRGEHDRILFDEMGFVAEELSEEAKVKLREGIEYFYRELLCKHWNETHELEAKGTYGTVNDVKEPIRRPAWLSAQYPDGSSRVVVVETDIV